MLEDIELSSPSENTASVSTGYSVFFSCSISLLTFMKSELVFEFPIPHLILILAVCLYSL